MATGERRAIKQVRGRPEEGCGQADELGRQWAKWACGTA